MSPRAAQLPAVAILSVCLIGCLAGRTQRVGAVVALPKGSDPTVLPSIVSDQLKAASVQNCSIYMGAINTDADQYYLFLHFEYTGSELENDVAAVTDILRPGDTASWSAWKEVFYTPGAPSDRQDVRRVGAVIELRPEPEKIIAYTQLHAATWPGVLSAIAEGNIRNYTIYHGQLEGKELLFSHFEYVGDDFEADMAGIGEDQVTQVWWTYTDPLQIRLPTATEGEQWSGIREVQYIR